jgi:hypothetical protein
MSCAAVASEIRVNLQSISTELVVADSASGGARER